MAIVNYEQNKQNVKFTFLLLSTNIIEQSLNQPLRRFQHMFSQSQHHLPDCEHFPALTLPWIVFYRHLPALACQTHTYVHTQTERTESTASEELLSRTVPTAVLGGNATSSGQTTLTPRACSSRKCPEHIWFTFVIPSKYHCAWYSDSGQ